jgi:phage terminase small subunit
MPRPRTPTNILRLTDALKRNPGRYADRVNEAKPSGPIGEPPEHLNGAERKAWLATVAECAPGVLTNADRGIVELTAQLRALVSSRAADGRARTLLRQCYAELGMTPASRSKVSAPAPDQSANEFAAV